MRIILIAAMAKNRVIGYQNTIPWHIKGEQKLFKEHTLGHTVVMGRKTYESIGKPLIGRKNIVISSQKQPNKISSQTNDETQIIFANSIQAALDLCKNNEKVFIIGGANIYNQTIDIADYIYLTIINRNVNGDTFFPEIDKKFSLISSQIIKLSEEVIFNVYERNYTN